MRVLDHRFDSIGNLLLLIQLTFRTDLANDPCENAIRIGSYLEPDGIAGAHVANFPLRHLNARQAVERSRRYGRPRLPLESNGRSFAAGPRRKPGRLAA